MNAIEESAAIAGFSLTTESDAHFSTVVFRHHGDIARGCAVRLGLLRDGRAYAGDGRDLGDRAADVRVVMFDPRQIDRSTIHADYAVPVDSGAETAIFLTWMPQSDPGQLATVGVVSSYVEDHGFRLEPMIDSDEAIEFMMRAGIIRQHEGATSRSVSEHGDAWFTELGVSGYRGFAEQRRIRFAKPSGAPGSGLTVIVGANNSGKSTFLEALHVVARAKHQPETTFPQPRRHHGSDAVVIELERSDGRRLRVETVRPGGNQAKATWLPVDLGPGRFDVHVTPSRRQFTPYFGNSGNADRNWGLLDQEFSRTQLRDNFVGRLRGVDRDPEARVMFDALLEEVVGKKLVWTIDEIASGQQFLKFVEPDGAWHTSEGLGDGLVSLLFIVDALYDSDPGALIAIDEPELSLHPQLVRRLGKVLSRYASDRQIVISTHSPLLLNWSDVANGATVARIYKVGNASEIAQASEQTLSKVAELAESRNLVNPHTVGTVAREAFFLEDGIILTEGQEDVAYLPRILDDLGLRSVDNFYGWGSGSVSNMPTLAQLFLELGFTKIGAIVDGDDRPETEAAFEKLAALEPKVLVRRIPAPDIRYKKPVPAKPEVIGLLDRNNRQVREELRAAAASVLREVLGHVKPDFS